MADYSVMFLDLSKVSTSATTFNTGTGSGLVGNSFTIASPATTGTLQVTDGDGWFDDDERTQVLGTSQVLNGTSYPGTYLVDQEYSFTVTDGTSTWRVYAVSTQETLRSTVNVVGFTFAGSIPPAGVTLTITSVTEGTSNQLAYSTLAPPAPPPICLAEGTRIDTPSGPRRVEDLRPGDRVLTLDGAAAPVLLVVDRRLRFHERGDKRQPVRIEAGALGEGLPTRPLVLSPQHRLRLWDGEGRAVLGPAGGLCDLPGVRRMAGARAVRYLHLLLPRHALIRAEGAAAETLLGGDQVLKGMIALPRALAGVARTPVLPLLTMGETRALAQAIRAGRAAWPGAAQSTSAISPRFLPEAFSAKVAAMNPSRSPFSTPCVSLVS